MMIERLKSVVADRVGHSKRLRIWSAGCSNGQEPYSIAMSVLEKIPEARNMDFKILASDIDPNVVNFAKAGCYPENMVSNLSDEILNKYFAKSENSSFQASEELQSKIAFRELNLLRNWPMKNSFDIIFCRNVVIYFDQETQQNLWPRFREKLSDRGHLFLGHSERMVSAESFGFSTCGPTAYTAEPMITRHTNNEIKETHNGTA